MSLKIQVVLILSIFNLVQSQNPSPCPDVFSYQPRIREQDRWYGKIILSTDADLSSTYVNVSLDRPAELFGYWFGSKFEAGKVTSINNKIFILRHPGHVLKAGTPQSVTFFVKYNAATTIPSVQGIRLNGREICKSAKSQKQQQHLSELSTLTTSVTTTTPSPRRCTLDEDDFRTIDQNCEWNWTTETTEKTTITPRRPSSLGDDKPTFGNHGTPDYYPGDYVRKEPFLSHQPSKHQTTQSSNNMRNKCGVVAMRPNTLISYGQSTVYGQFPWHAALYHNEGTDLKYTCGGTLITERHVITAAHCVTKQQTNKPLNNLNVVVYLGKNELLKFGAEVQERGVSDILVHPEYNASGHFNDVAILKLEVPAEFTNHVRACCLWEGSTDLEPILGRLGTVVGWGYDETGGPTNALMQAQMPIVSTVDCIYSNREFFSQFTSNKTYCAGFKNGTTVCNGDSGGGMVMPKTSSSTETVWQLRGLVSVSKAAQEQAVCDPTNYIIFTDLAKHSDWITQITKQS